MGCVCGVIRSFGFCLPFENKSAQKEFVLFGRPIFGSDVVLNKQTGSHNHRLPCKNGGNYKVNTIIN